MSLHITTYDYDTYSGGIIVPPFDDDNRYLRKLARKDRYYSASTLLEKIALLAASEGNRQEIAQAIAVMAYVAYQVLKDMNDGARFTYR